MQARLPEILAGADELALVGREIALTAASFAFATLYASTA